MSCSSDTYPTTSQRLSRSSGKRRRGIITITAAISSTSVVKFIAVSSISSTTSTMLIVMAPATGITIPTIISSVFPFIHLMASCMTTPTPTTATATTSATTTTSGDIDSVPISTTTIGTEDVSTIQPLIEMISHTGLLTALRYGPKRTQCPLRHLEDLGGEVH